MALAESEPVSGALMDSATARRLPVIPEWAVHFEFPLTGLTLSPAESSVPLFCEQIVQFDALNEIVAPYFDSNSEITHIYAGDYDHNCIVRHDVDRFLNHTEATLPLDYGVAGLVADLDQDGSVELIVQRGDPGFGGNGYLDIHSAPSWTLRRRFTFPGMKVYMNPVAVNVDDDPYLELYITPSDLGLTGRVILIKYYAASDSFGIHTELLAGVGGVPAVADFDNDGRIEFISGHRSAYSLFEFNGVSLVYVNDLGAPYGGFSAATVRPKPGGVLHVLLGSGSDGHRYQLLEPTGNNTFELRHIFESSGHVGVSRCGGADVDCDGLDELVMFLPPQSQVWEWDEDSGQFVAQGCTWGGTRYYPVDLNQDVVPEWGTVDVAGIFRDIRHDCVSCLAPPLGILAWWPLDEDVVGTAIDVWGGNHGGHVAEPVPVTGRVEHALNLDGLSQYVAVDPSISLNVGTGDFSVDAWVKTSSSVPVNPVISQYDPLSQRGWALWIESGDALEIRLADGFVSEITSLPVELLSDGTWHHIAVTIDRDDASGIEFFVDGESVGIGNPTGVPGSLNNHRDLFIGRWGPVSDDSVYFDGVLDEVRLFGRALAAQEVRSVVTVDSLGNCRPDGIVCNCAQHGDVVGDDGVIDAQDITALVAHVFAGIGAPPQDPLCPHIDRGDLNCDSVKNALDIVSLIDIVFRNGNASCNPCMANQ
jgi:hypothetical protein